MALMMLSWSFQVNDLNLSFAQELEQKATKYLKSWARIFRNAKLSLLYGSRENFGLELTSVSMLYQQCQVSKCYIVKHSSDPLVAKLYQERLVRESQFTRVWKPCPQLEDLESQVRFHDKFGGQIGRAGLGLTVDHSSHKDKVKAILKKGFHDAFHSADCTKALQGVNTRFHDCIPFDLSWNHLLSTRNPALVSWVLNASINSVCTPDMLKLWNYVSNAQCGLCGHECCSISHILSSCKTALTQKRYTWRHDSCLLTLKPFLEARIKEANENPPVVDTAPAKIAFIRAGETERIGSKQKILHLLSNSNDWQLLVDFDHANIVFPVNICITKERPDIVIWSLSSKRVILIELTCPMEENIMDARTRKNARYGGDSQNQESLIDQIKGNEWSPVLLTIEVGARGMVSRSVIRTMHKLGFARSNTKTIYKKLSRVVASCSFAIFRCQKVKEWQSKPLVEL